MRILIFLIFFFPYLLLGQYEDEKRDAVWLTGISCNFDTVCPNLVFDFSQGTLDTYLEYSNIGFIFTNAAISDTDGNLLYATDGCRIIDGNYNMRIKG